MENERALRRGQYLILVSPQCDGPCEGAKKGTPTTRGSALLYREATEQPVMN